jgi:hypothetical protein
MARASASVPVCSRGLPSVEMYSPVASAFAMRNRQRPCMAGVWTSEQNYSSE